MDRSFYRALSLGASRFGKKIMLYLNPEEILVIHARIIDATGGSHGVRDVLRIASMAERLKIRFGGKDLYPTIFTKAATLLHSCAMDHPFVDGNKRTAITIAARFLFLNGYELSATNSILEKFVLEVVIKKLDIKPIAVWFKKHSKKL